MKRININENQYRLIIESGVYQSFSASDGIETYYRGTDKKQTILMKEERILFPGKVHAVPENQFIPPES